MTLPFSYLALPGFNIGAAQSPQQPRLDPVNDQIAYITYEDVVSNPGILTIAAIDMVTQSVIRRTAIANTDSQGTIAIAFAADNIVLWAGKTGAAAFKFWLLKKSDFSTISFSADFTLPTFLSSSVNDANIAISNDGQWVAVDGGFDGGGPGQYIEIWHSTTNVLYQSLLSAFIATPNTMRSLCFDGSNNLYMNVGIHGGFYKFSLAEVAGVIVPALIGTFTLPFAPGPTLFVKAITYHPSVNKFSLWCESPQSGSQNLLLQFWDIGTDIIDPVSYTIPVTTVPIDVGTLSIFDMQGATNRTQFVSIFGSPVSFADCFFGVFDITTGIMQQYLISLWDPTGNVFGGNDPPNAFGVYSPSVNDFYISQNGVSFGPPDLHSIAFSLPAPPPRVTPIIPFRTILPLPKPKYAFSMLLARECNTKGL